MRGCTKSKYEITLYDKALYDDNIGIKDNNDTISIHRITGKNITYFMCNIYNLYNYCFFTDIIYLDGFKAINYNDCENKIWKSYIIVPDDRAAWDYFHWEVLPKLKEHYGTIDERIQNKK